MDTAVPDETACLQYVRDCSGGDEVTCPHCGGERVIMKGTTSKDAQRYLCRDCHSYFNELTNTVFTGQRLTLGEMVFIIWQMDRRSVTDIANDLDRTYKTVLKFVHKVRARIHSDPIVTAIRGERDTEQW